MVDEIAALREQIKTLVGERDRLARAVLGQKRKLLARLLATKSQPRPAQRLPSPQTGGPPIPQAERPATSRQVELLCFVDAHPMCSVRELAAGLGVASTNGVCQQCRALRAKGLLVWEARRWRSLRLTDSGRAVVMGAYRG